MHYKKTNIDNEATINIKKIQQGNTTKYNPIVEVNCEEEKKHDSIY